LGAQDGALGVGVVLGGGDLRGDLLEVLAGCGDSFFHRGDLGLGVGDGGVLGGERQVRVQEFGEFALSVGQRGFGACDRGAGFFPGGVVDDRGVGADIGAVVAQPVDAVVRGEVFEDVLDAPAAAQPGQQRRRGGGGVAGALSS
jgi:hypothetical protein